MCAGFNVLSNTLGRPEFAFFEFKFVDVDSFSSVDRLTIKGNVCLTHYMSLNYLVAAGTKVKKE